MTYLAKVYLCSMPFLDVNYDNIIDFENVRIKAKYFEDRAERDFDSNVKYDGERPYIVVKEEMNNLLKFDYLFVHGNCTNIFYYFIKNIEFVTEGTTKLWLKLDVWTTYSHLLSYMPSFVDRCHVPRWTSDGLPTQNNEEEGLEMGEYIMTDLEKLYDYKDGVVVSSSVPIGYVPGSSGGSGGGG